MRKLTILVDMDDTIENLCEVWVEMLNEKHGRRVELCDIVDWDMSLFFPGLTREELYAPLFTRELYQRITPLPGARKHMEMLMDDGHKILLVTASHPATIQMKYELVIKRYFPFIDTKGIITAYEKQRIKGDVLIDDAPHNLENGDYIGVLFDSHHNKTYDAESNGFRRVKSWSEIYDYINKLCRKDD